MAPTLRHSYFGFVSDFVLVFVDDAEGNLTHDGPRRFFDLNS
jgi:hypothetical protein